MDKLRALRVFVAVAEGGSLSAAARSLRTSVQSVMRLLESLEASLGIRLVHRTTRQLSITDEGRAYLERVRRVLADLQEAEDAIQQGTDDVHGNLVVSSPVLMGQMHVAPLVREFIAANPRIRVKLLLLDRVVNLVDEGVDVTVRIGDLPDSSLVARPVSQLCYQVLASPGYLGRFGEARHPNDLKAANCLRFADARSAEWTFQEDGRPLSVRVAGSFDSNLVGPLLEASADGLGIVRVQSYQAASYIEEGRLRPILQAFEPPAHAISLVYVNRAHLPARLRRFTDWMHPRLARRLESQQDAPVA